jgi:hypothetical protein
MWMDKEVVVTLVRKGDPALNLKRVGSIETEPTYP